MTMQTDTAESLGEIADTLDNLLAAMNLPIPAEQHLAILKQNLTHCRNVLRRVYVAETGYNAWKFETGEVGE